MNLIVPCVHMNGTSKPDLENQLEEAYLAIGNAIDALKKAAPNARDYYVYDSGAYEEAREQHFARMEKLYRVQNELGTIHLAILENSGRYVSI